MTNLPTLHREDGELAGGGLYLILWDTGTRWSVTTGVYETLAQCYDEAREIVARQFRISPAAAIRDYHGTWQY